MEKEEKQLEVNYRDEDKTYIGEERELLRIAYDNKEMAHSEFDGQTYTQRHESNEKAANTQIEPKKNKYDNDFHSGMTRNKVMAVASAISILNQSPDISAYNPDNVAIHKLGNGMEHIIYETEEIEGDREKKISRTFELLKQGDIFCQEIWKDILRVVKTMNKKFDGKLNVKWNERLKRDLPHPERNIISGLGVFLGDIRQPELKKQPYIFTVEVTPYKNAELTYGEWDRWKYVPKKIVRNEHTQGDQDVLYGWNITEIEDDSVEIIKYQDKPNNEYAIFINGILMTPKGLPFQWGWDDYNIVQQGLEDITPTFAYHKSMPERMKTDVAIYDEILRLAVFLTKKAGDPPRANLSGRVLSEKTFMPGMIITGLNPNQVPLIDANGSQGVTSPIMTMVDKLYQTINEQSVSPSFQGQQANVEQTATEVLTAQKQSKASIGIMVIKNGLLEKQLSWLRLYNNIENWFVPIDTVVDEARGILKNVYRTVNKETPIEGKGMGRTMVVPVEEATTREDVYSYADKVGHDRIDIDERLAKKQEPDKILTLLKEDEIEKKTGVPTRIISIGVNFLKTAKLIWQIQVKPREEMTSELGKLMVERYLQGLAMFPNVNYDEVGKDYALAWEKDPAKVFLQGQSATPTEEITPTGSTKDVPELGNIIKKPKQNVI